MRCGEHARRADVETTICGSTGFFKEMQHPVEGKVALPAIAAEFSASPPSVRRLWPTLGQHTEEVPREAGYDDGDILGITSPE